MPTTIPLLLFALMGYLLGSIPFGLLLTRMAGLGDVRAIGSGNIGATNVLRTGNRVLAAATLLLDAFKATLATWIGFRFGGLEAGLLAGFSAFIGHLFPIWLSFKGGKGVATFVGILVGVDPLLALIFSGVWLVTVFTSRYSSLSGLVASLVVIGVGLFMSDYRITGLVAIMTLIIWIKHRANIQRLIKGTESKIGK